MTTAPASRPIPRDGRLISLILASKGIDDADERIIHQLLDFAHRYTADVLTSAQSLADHAGRPAPQRIDKDDVELAIQLRRRYEFFEAPPRDYLATLSHELNTTPLPLLPETFDVLRLPPAHQRLAEVNFDLVPPGDLLGGVAEASDEEDEEDEDDEEGEGESESDEDVDAGGGKGGTKAAAADGRANGQGGAEDEDEEMEMVDVGEGEAGGGAGAAGRQEREVDEDYDA